jgi:hypothetical protein
MSRTEKMLRNNYIQIAIKKRIMITTPKTKPTNLWCKRGNQDYSVENLLNEVIAENFPNPGKEMDKRNLEHQKD